MIALWLAVAMLVAVLVFEAGSAWQRRFDRRRVRRVASRMQAKVDARLHGGRYSVEVGE